MSAAPTTLTMPVRIAADLLAELVGIDADEARGLMPIFLRRVGYPPTVQDVPVADAVTLLMHVIRYAGSAAGAGVATSSLSSVERHEFDSRAPRRQPSPIVPVPRAAAGDPRSRDTFVAPQVEPCPGDAVAALQWHWPGLTVREAQILYLIAAGDSNQQIGRTLFLSINSVKTYVRLAYRKIGVASRAQAAGAVIARAGVVPPAVRA